MKKSMFLVTFLVVLVLCVVVTEQARPAEASSVTPGGILLYLQGVQGDCRKAGYEGWIELKSFDYGISTSGSTDVSGRIAPDTRKLDFRLVKRLDRASPLLNLYVCQQRYVREAKILIVGSDGSKVLYKMAYTLKNVMITSITTSASDSAGAEPLESMSFSYEGITWEYTPVDTGGDPVRTTWSLTPVR